MAEHTVDLTTPLRTNRRRLRGRRGGAVVSEPIIITLKSGLALRLELGRPDLTDRIVKHYEKGHSALWECPWCGGGIDSLCYEVVDGMFEDTYSCDGDCNLLITHITPKTAGEYHNVAYSEWTVMIEGEFGSEWTPPGEASDEVTS